MIRVHKNRAIEFHRGALATRTQEGVVGPWVVHAFMCALGCFTTVVGCVIAFSEFGVEGM